MTSLFAEIESSRGRPVPPLYQPETHVNGKAQQQEVTWNVWVQTAQFIAGPAQLASTALSATAAAASNCDTTLCLDSTGRHLTYLCVWDKPGTRVGVVENARPASPLLPTPSAPPQLTVVSEADTQDAVASDQATEVHIDAICPIWDEDSALCLTSTGTLFEWTGVLASASSLLPIPFNRVAVQVSCGARHYAILDEDGEIWVAGSNADGQLGELPDELPHSSTLRPFPCPNDAVPVSSVTCGGRHTVILSSDSTSLFQAGLGNHVCQPVPFPKEYSARKVTSLAAGDDFAVAVIVSQHNAASVVSWGISNISGQLGWAPGKQPRSPRDVHPVPTGTLAIQTVQASGYGAVARVAGPPNSVLRGSIIAWGDLGFGTPDPAESSLITQVRSTLDTGSRAELAGVTCCPKAVAVLVAVHTSRGTPPGAPRVPSLRLGSGSTVSHDVPDTTSAQPGRPAEEFWRRWGQERPSVAVPPVGTATGADAGRPERRRLTRDRMEVASIVSTLTPMGVRRLGSIGRHGFLSTAIRRAGSKAEEEEEVSKPVEPLAGPVPPTTESLLSAMTAGPWDTEPLKGLRALVEDFDTFRSECITAWTNYLFAEFYGVPVGQAKTASIQDLRQLYMTLSTNVRRRLDGDGTTLLDPFDRSTVLLSRRLRRRHAPSQLLTTWAAVRRALVARWLPAYLSDTPIEGFNPASASSSTLSAAGEARLKALRCAAYSAVAGVEVVDDVPRHHWEIELEELSMLQLCRPTSLLPTASAAASGVFSARFRGTLVAVKTAHVASTPDNVMFKRLREIFTHATVRHPHVVTFMGACIRGPVVCLVTEWMERGTFWDMLHESACQVDWRTVSRLAMQVASAISYMHKTASAPLIHRDIKSSNVFLTGGDPNGIGIIAKVGDFDLARRLPLGLGLNSEHSALARHYLLTSVGIPAVPWAAEGEGSSGSMAYLLEHHRHPTPLSQVAAAGGSEQLSRAPYATACAGSFAWMAPEVFDETVATTCMEKTMHVLDMQFRQAMDTLAVILEPDFLMPRRASTNEKQAETAAAPTESTIPLFYTEKADVFSFGVLLWELCCRTPPFLGLDGKTVAQLVRDRGVRLPVPETAPLPLKAILAACWHSDPVQRPDMAAVCESLAAWDMQIELEHLAAGTVIVETAKTTFSKLIAAFGRPA